MEEKILSRMALRHLLATRGWLNETYAPSCSALTPSMRGVSKSDWKTGAIEPQGVMR